jgi:anti-anti-sigma factor
VVVPFPGKVLSEEWVRAVARSVRESGRRAVCLDLRGVERPTAGGLGGLVALHRRLRAAGGGLTLANVGAAVHEALAVTRLTEVLPVRAE